MPVTGNASYIPARNEFLAHWFTANAALPPALPLIVNVASTGTTRAQFESRKGDLQDQQAAVQAALNDVEINRAPMTVERPAA